jgi:hypothetical protein
MVHLENPPLEQAVRAMETEQAERAYVDQLRATEPKEYRPSNQEALREYEIRLQFLNRGCIVHVGCKSIAFETVESAMKEVNDYVNNTWESQQRWRKILS